MVIWRKRLLQFGRRLTTSSSYSSIKVSKKRQDTVASEKIGTLKFVSADLVTITSLQMLLTLRLGVEEKYRTVIGHRRGRFSYNLIEVIVAGSHTSFS